MQPEIAFINKLIIMRKVSERLGGNRKPGVMGVVNWLDTHIRANQYSHPNESRMFALKHFDKIEYIIPYGKPKLIKEWNQLLYSKRNLGLNL